MMRDLDASELFTEAYLALEKEATNADTGSEQEDLWKHSQPFAFFFQRLHWPRYSFLLWKLSKRKSRLRKSRNFNISQLFAKEYLALEKVSPNVETGNKRLKCLLNSFHSYILFVLFSLWPNNGKAGHCWSEGNVSLQLYTRLPKWISVANKKIWTNINTQSKITPWMNAMWYAPMPLKSLTQLQSEKRRPRSLVWNTAVQTYLSTQNCCY